MAEHKQGSLTVDPSVAAAFGVFERYHPTDENPFQMFRHVAETGVTFATSRARWHGFDPEDQDWANMGQGAPETGPLEGAPPRDYKLDIKVDEIEYAPVTGVMAFREKVANYYNHLYRQGKASQYTAANVCMVPGGRAGMTQVMSVLGNTQVGYFIPDYTAYEQSVGLFARITPSAYIHRDVNRPIMKPEEFEFQTRGRGVGAILMSNPCNPTGQCVEGEDLAEYVRIARETDTCLVMDEFYSHYFYDGTQVDPADGGADDDSNWPKTVSSAAYIEDVNKEPICIINGLTKNWRCPGFRVCWVVAPAPIVDVMGNSGSFLHGGANAPLQHLSLPLMDLDFIRKDAWALQRHFKKKRDYLLNGLDSIGIHVHWQPHATFYVWGDISKLPSPLNDSLIFLEECTKAKVVCVPGVFFDINPRGTRNLRHSRCNANMRFSYGPPMHNLVAGVKNLGEMIAKWKASPMTVEDYDKDVHAKYNIDV